MIVDYIDAHREKFGVVPICAVLSQHGATIAPSTYYASVGQRVSVADLDDAYRANELFDLHRANRGVYGRRKLWHAARRAGLRIGRDQVARLMRMVGVAGAVRGAHATITTRRSLAAEARHRHGSDRSGHDRSFLRAQLGESNQFHRSSDSPLLPSVRSWSGPGDENGPAVT